MKKYITTWEKHVFRTALRKWGDDAQIGQLHEEIGELVVAINKLRRADQYGFKPLDGESINDARMRLVNDVLSEIADVEIMLAQIKVMLDDIHGTATETHKEMKMARLAEWLDIPANTGWQPITVEPWKDET